MADMAALEGASSARRRRDRQFLARHCHVQRVVVMELATALHHSAQKPKERVVEELRGGVAREAQRHMWQLFRGACGPRIRWMSLRSRRWSQQRAWRSSDGTGRLWCSSPSSPKTYRTWRNSSTSTKTSLQTKKGDTKGKAPKGTSPSGKSNKRVCYDCKKEQCPKHPHVAVGHPPECSQYKSKSGCTWRDKCGFLHTGEAGDDTYRRSGDETVAIISQEVRELCIERHPRICFFSTIYF